MKEHLDPVDKLNAIAALLDRISRELNADSSTRAGETRVDRVMHLIPEIPLISEISCTPDELRRDVAQTELVLTGLKEAARRMEIHGRSIVYNQHALIEHFHPIYVLIEDLKSRGMRLDGVRAINLAGLPIWLPKRS